MTQNNIPPYGTVTSRTELAPGQPLDRRSLRGALGMFATGVTVITTQLQNGDCVGFTANSFSSVSLEPPLVLFSLGLQSSCLEAMSASSHYAINVLSEEQTALSHRFAASGEDKFSGLDWLPGAGGAPLLPGCCAWFECANEVQHAGGDHMIFVGRVLAYAREQKQPLIFHEGRYRNLVA